MTTLTMVRRDSVDPEYSAGYYRLGCEVNPVPLGCLSCPLPVCKYDLPRSLQQGKLNRNRVRELASQGLAVAEIAASLGLSTRVVHRYKAEIR